MRVVCLALLLFSTPAVAQDIGEVQCGTRKIGEMMREGWLVVKADHLENVSDNKLTLEDGSIYEADNTVGMLQGDQAILLSKHVRSKKSSGYIYTICAGGFDAWVTPVG